MTKTWDVAIAGGGIIGGAIAFELARRGVNVIVLDKQSPGNEASWAAAGMLSPTPHSAHDIPLLPLMAASAAIYPEFVAAVESTSGEHACFQQIGAMEALFATDAEREMNTLLAFASRIGIANRPLPLAQAFELEPSLSRTRAQWRCAIPKRAWIIARSLRRCCARRPPATRNFARIRRWKKLLLTNDRCAGVIAGGEKIPARNVVIAAGCYSAQIDGVARYAPVRPVRGQMVAMRSDHVDLKHVLRSEKCYIVPRGNGICIAGSTLEDVGFVKRVTPDGIAKILNAVLEMVPGLADAEVIETWSGLRPATPDHLPSLGTTDIDGLIIATGHYRNGILLTPITARLVAAWITGERIAIACDAFSPMRFANARK